MGFAFEAARPFAFTSNGDPFGWRENGAGRFDYALFIQNGRVSNLPGKSIMDGLRAIARVHKGLLRLTPNQNLIIADVEPEARAAIDVLLTEHRSEEHTYELQSLMRISYAVVCLNQKTTR